MPLVKNYYLNMEEDDNQLEINCQNCNSFVTCKGRSVELFYVNFLYDIFSKLGRYTKGLDPENFH